MKLRSLSKKMLQIEHSLNPVKGEIHLVVRKLLNVCNGEFRKCSATTPSTMQKTKVALFRVTFCSRMLPIFALFIVELECFLVSPVSRYFYSGLSRVAEMLHLFFAVVKIFVGRYLTPLPPPPLFFEGMLHSQDVCHSRQYDQL